MVESYRRSFKYLSGGRVPRLRYVQKEKMSHSPRFVGRTDTLRQTFIYYLDPVILEEKHEHKKRFSSDSRPNKVNRMASICKEASSKGLCE